MLLFAVEVDPVEFLFLSLTVVLSISLSLGSFFRESLLVDIIFFTYWFAKKGAIVLDFSYSIVALLFCIIYICRHLMQVYGITFPHAVFECLDLFAFVLL